MFQLLTLVVVVIIIAVVAFMLVVVSATRAALDRSDRSDRREEQHRRRKERPAVHGGQEAWRQWAAYYRGLAEQAHAEGNINSSTTYDSLAETYRALAGDAP